MKFSKVVSTVLAVAVIGGTFSGCAQMIPKKEPEKLKLIENGVFTTAVVTNSYPITFSSRKLTKYVDADGNLLNQEMKKQEKDPIEAFLGMDKEKENYVVYGYKNKAKDLTSKYRTYYIYTVKPIKKGSKLRVYHREHSTKIEAIFIGE